MVRNRSRANPERILAAFSNLGFQFRNAYCEKGRIWGVHQELPFYQEIEFYPPSAYASGINQLELTFLPTPHTLQVVLEIDKRGGIFTEGTISAWLDQSVHMFRHHTEGPRIVVGSSMGGWLALLLRRALGDEARRIAVNIVGAAIN